MLARRRWIRSSSIIWSGCPRKTESRRQLSMMLKIAIALLLSGCIGCSHPVEKTMSLSDLPYPPVAPKKPHETTVHGRTLTDDYFWLRDRKDPEVSAYLKAEDGYAEAVMKPTAPLQ